MIWVLKNYQIKSKLSVSYITELEKGNSKAPTIVALAKIGNACNIKLSQIMTLEEYHESIITTEDKLKAYQNLIIKSLEIYQENTEKHKSLTLKK